MAERAADWLARRGGVSRAVLAVLGGALATLALPPIYALPLLLLSFPLLLLLALTSRGRLAAFAAGWWFGIGHFTTGLYWVAIAFVVNQDVSDAAGPVAVAGLAILLAIFPGLVALAYKIVAEEAVRRGRRFGPIGHALAFAVLWSLGEWLRGHLFTGFPWNLIGSVWGFAPVMMQSAALWGLYGLGLLTMTLALSPLGYLLPAPGGRRWMLPTAALTLAVGLLGFGLWRLATADPAVVAGVRLRLVQANVSQQDKWSEERLFDNFGRYLALSAAAGNPSPSLIVWPETAVPYYLNAEPARRYLIADVVPADGYVITGAPRLERLADGRYQVGNSLFVIDGRGAVRAAYDKAHLVPFGEYLPLRGLLGAIGLNRFVPSLLDFTPGPGLATLTAPGLPPFSPLICYEAIFPGAVARRDQPPDWLLNVTNDAWYGISSGPYQHLVAARFRAVEEGLPVVRAAGTGISAVIDPWGRTLASLGLARAGVIDADLPRKIERRTPFARLGDWSYLLILVIVSAAAFRSVRP